MFEYYSNILFDLILGNKNRCPCLANNGVLVLFSTSQFRYLCTKMWPPSESLRILWPSHGLKLAKPDLVSPVNIGRGPRHTSHDMSFPILSSHGLNPWPVLRTRYPILCNLPAEFPWEAV